MIITADTVTWAGLGSVVSSLTRSVSQAFHGNTNERPVHRSCAPGD